MIKVDGYKAFHGVMRITPKSKCVSPFEVEGDWLYKPDTGCWYCKGRSYGADICTVVRDDSEMQTPKKPVIKNHIYIGTDDDFCIMYYCPACKSLLINEDTNGFYAGKKQKYCPDCGQGLDWSNE